VRYWIVAVLAMLMSSALAIAFPREGRVLVTDAAGTIIGLGRVADGATFELDLLEGFAGAVTLIFVTDDGVEVLEATVAAGVVLLDGVDLAALLSEAGFVTVRVDAFATLAGADGPHPRSEAGRGDASAPGSGHAGDRVPDGVEPGSGGASGVAGGPRDDPPGLGGAEQPFPPAERPVVPPATRGAP
jgi:hypothetical protein